ncbi:UDP-rhamnose/UDP-galactose transporter 3 [Hondaea fermentalgiana]|uniref:UDP-rhamnose/UDP-galactose transporter 3 n=1 Tax=Hondaea fermentalgiana TaxID=2315210 RepID=A0A2R5GQI9_9STRA|nr:UDP-rhamnose/UDP-galactose transporter 3 [Hondaea fermentalgiana]|eukprot:GBG32579.1 UDP-rhamnose/UDP-galactose transporter 3 [Hondaea fermentalgiana]
MAYPTWALIIGSILSSVALVVVNKQIFTRGFTHVFTLSTFHFVWTAGLLHIMARVFKLFEVKRVSMLHNLLVASFGVGSICLMNFSLKLNSVGFYQMMKLCIVPCCLLLNAVRYDEYPTRKVVGALVLVLIGVGIATVTDVQLNLLGSVFGVAAVLVTAQYQIWQGRKQKEWGMSSQELALSVSTYQIGVGAVLAIIFEGQDLLLKPQGSDWEHLDDPLDPNKGIAANLRDGASAAAAAVTSDGSDEAVSLTMLILLSCLLAVSVNVHSFALIGKTSAVTFQVVGHGKTCLILASGYMMHISEGNPIEELYRNIFGVVVALSGVILYSNLKITPATSKDICDKCLPHFMLRLVSSRENEKVGSF